MKALGIAIVVVGAFVFFFGWLIRFFVGAQTNNCVEKILKDPSKQNPRALENPKNGTLIANETTFKIRSPGGQAAELLWNEVEEIRAFKKDLVTTDLICLALKTSRKEVFHEINEEMAGYFELLEAMEKYLPGFNLHWMLDAALPAFSTNHHMIWKRRALTTA